MTKTTYPSVLMCSMWRNDAHRDIVNRVEHLLAKSESWLNMCWLWVVGDSDDETLDLLRALSTGYPVTIVDIETGIEGDDMTSRMRRVSETGNEYWPRCSGFDYVLIHESDIISPYNLVPRLVAQAETGICPLAAWPTLEIQPGMRWFYDTYVYRKDGQHFTNTPPYHPCYRSNEVFEVDSAGTIMLLHGEDAELISMKEGGFLDICSQLRVQGRTIYVDPRIEVVQPHALWIPRSVFV